MRGATRRSLAILGLAIASAGSINQCAKDLSQRLQPPRPEQAGFEPAEVREVGLTDDGGRIVDMVVVSTQPRSWNHASNLFRPWAACKEGRDYAVTQRTPGFDVEDDKAWSRHLPEGTRFVQRVACEGPLPNAMEWPPDLLPPDAMQLIIRRLKPSVPPGPDGDVPGLEFRSAGYGLDYQEEKYEAFNRLVGDATKDQHARCGGPVTLVDIATISGSEAARSSADFSKTLIVGMYFECARRSDAPPGPEHPPSTSTAQ